MRPLVAPLLFLAAALAVPAPASAAMLGDASVSYRAWRTVTVDGRSYAGAVYHEPGHERHEQDLMGLHGAFLLDLAAARGMLVLPGMKTEIDFVLPPLMAELDDPDLTRHPAGVDKVGGVQATKYKIDHKAQDGSRAEGFLWVSRAGILVKLDVAVTRGHGGRPMAIAMELSRLETGPVDPALFRAPEGYSKLPAEALAPLLGGATER